MITPQAIREKTFEKAVFGGHDMASVDSFLEELINDFTTLQKENAVLKAKMKVLVDKVEEYRGNEDALRMAVLSAQKLGNMIEAEAKQKAEKMLADAKAEAAKLTREANLEVEVEQARLAESRNASAKFIDSMDMLCRRQLDFLKKIGEMDFVQQLRTESAAAPAQPAPAAPVQPAAQPEIHETVKSIEETVAKVMDEPAVTVRPDITPTVADDERPTRAFGIVSDPADDIDRTTQFSLDDFRK